MQKESDQKPSRVIQLDDEREKKKKKLRQKIIDAILKDAEKLKW